MKILVKRNWEDIICTSCRSELRLHPQDLWHSLYDKYRESTGGPVQFWVNCPVCDAKIVVNVPDKYQDQISYRGWPRCPCEGNKDGPHSNRAGYEFCDWPDDLKYRSPEE